MWIILHAIRPLHASVLAPKCIGFRSLSCLASMYLVLALFFNGTLHEYCAFRPATCLSSWRTCSSRDIHAVLAWSLCDLSVSFVLHFVHKLRDCWKMLSSFMPLELRAEASLYGDVTCTLWTEKYFRNDKSETAFHYERSTEASKPFWTCHCLFHASFLHACVFFFFSLCIALYLCSQSPIRKYLTSKLTYNHN